MRSIFNFLLALPAVFAAPTALQPREEIADSWIVKVRENAVLADVISQVYTITNAQPTHEYSFGAFKGFSLDGVSGLTALLANIASIESIEPNAKVYANAVKIIQNKPPYGLARISHRNKGATSYIYDSSAGAGTFAYIIDTGIYTQHHDFGGRAIKGANFITGESDNDGNGHGTHVAGTTGSRTYGVAKKTTLIAVKVLGSDGSGSTAGVLAGINWAVNDAKAKNRIGKAVANMSLGGPTSPSTNSAVAEAIKQGLFIAVAAGNDGRSASTSSPASEQSACTVGATDSNDSLASFSNYGSLVDILAPGVNVLSTWNTGPDSTNTISGTSMATPHITGLAAYLLGLEGAKTPAALCQRIQDLSTKNKVSLGLLQSLSGTKNYLAYNGNGA